MSITNQVEQVEQLAHRTAAAPRQHLLDLDPAQLTAWLATHNMPAFRARQVTHWVHHQGVIDLDRMSNLSKSLRSLIEQHFSLDMPTITQAKIAADGCIKWLLRLADGNTVEMVYIPEVKVLRDLTRARATLCISSQAGCALNCSFCATGKQGFSRNLSLSEIMAQLWIARNQLQKHYTHLPPITNVVFMGMGEPLLNYDPVVAAANLMTSDLAYGLSKKRVTISTSGVLPAMQQLRYDTDVALALSLHAPNDALRNQLVPINRKYPLAELMALCRNYFSPPMPQAELPVSVQSSKTTQARRGVKTSVSNQRKRKVMMEYVMLDGINDHPQHAKQLMRLLEGVPCKINLIPFNPFPGTDYASSKPEVVSAFQQRLIAAGYNVRVRRTRADDVAAACGQLAGEVKDRTGRHAKWRRERSLG